MEAPGAALAMDGERCVHALAVNAQCQACVAACPRDALVLEDDGLGWRAEACDDCGLCVPACPRGVMARTPPAHEAVVIHDDGAGFAACEKAPVPHAASPLPCKHALGLRELLKLAQIGLHHLTLLTGDCGSCPRARTGQMFEAALALHQSMRSSRGEDAIGVHLVQEPAAYHAAKRGSRGAPARVDSRKRALFTGLFRRSHARPRALPASALAAYAPVFDLEKCTACDACARICPDGALLRERGAAAGYRIFPELCSGCGLCVDLCNDEAMRLESPAAAAPSFVPLEARHCRACGVSFAWIAARPRDQQTECPVCRKTMRTRQLFQVLRDP